MRIVITGPPCSGKSSVIEPISNIHVTIPEVAREWIAWFTKHEPYHLPWNNRPYFQPFVETQQLLNFQIELIPKGPIFFDRGLPDEVGYRKFFGMDIPQTLIDNCHKHRYDKVFYFPFWESIYKKDAERVETHEDAKFIDECLRWAYTECGYDLVEVPFAPIDERVEYIKKHLKIDEYAV